MTTPKQCSWKLLATPYGRACAKLAEIARHDTIYGGASALVIARRMDSRKCAAVPAVLVVTDIYTGRRAAWTPYACPECGQAYLGKGGALNCCPEGDSAP